MSKQPIDLGWRFNTDDLKRHGFNSIDEYMAQRGYAPADDDENSDDGDGIFAGLVSVAGGVLLLLFLSGCGDPTFTGMVSDQTYWNECQKMSGHGDIWEEPEPGNVFSTEFKDNANARWYQRNCQ